MVGPLLLALSQRTCDHHATPRDAWLPQGVKKPYNPIIGESFAATWEHDDGSRSQYVGEQVRQWHMRRLGDAEPAVPCVCVLHRCCTDPP